MNPPQRRLGALAALALRLSLRHFWTLLAAALALVAVRAWLDNPPVRAWLWETTGESDAAEGWKGTVALALLQAKAPALSLEPERPIAHLGTAPYGVNTFFQLEADPDVVRRSMATLRDAHITWARQQFPWEDIEIHGRGDFEDRRNRPYRSAWTKYDRIVQEAENHGVRLLVRLDDPPAWAYADAEKSGDKGPPDDLADYAAFVRAVAGRYCDKVRYYQLWNEPNIYPEWGNRDVDPAGYARLLKAGAAALRETCPEAVVVSAALAQTTEPGGKNMDDLKYLEGLYAADWQHDFDILAVQAFGLWTGPTDQRVSPDRANFSRPMLARDIMVRHGDGLKAVWITEMGWDSPPEFIPPPDAPPTATLAAGTPMPAPYGRVTEADRGRYTARAYQRILEDWPWVGVGFTWFLRRPNREWHGRPEGYFRLIEPEWQPLPAFTAMADAAGAVPAVYRGRHDPDDEALRYAGPWRNAPLEGPVEQRVLARDAELAFDFVGRGFTIRFAPPRALLARSEDGRFRLTHTPTPTMTPRPTFTPVPTSTLEATPVNVATARARETLRAEEASATETAIAEAAIATSDAATATALGTPASSDASEPISPPETASPSGPTPDLVGTVVAMATGQTGPAQPLDAANPAGSTSYTPESQATSSSMPPAEGAGSTTPFTGSKPTAKPGYPGPSTDVLRNSMGGAAVLTPTFFLVLDGDHVQLPLQNRDGVLVLESPDLPYDRHSLIMRVDDGEAWVDEIFVTAPDPTSPWWGLLRLLGALAMILGAILAGRVLLPRGLQGWRGRAR